MGDFYTVLRQSIIDRGLTSPEARDEAYAQARRAMVNRLWAYTPPLAEDEIDQRIGQFDAAVARIEDDVVEVFAAREEAEARDEDPATPDGAADADDGEDADYPPSFGGAPGEEKPGDRATRREAASPPAGRRSLDEASRAVELALLEAEIDAGAAAEAGLPDGDELPDGPAFPEDDPADDPLAVDGAAATAARDHRPSAPPRAEGPPRLERLRQDIARLLPASEQSRLRLLIGAVAVLSVILVGGIVWILLARPAPPAPPPVVLQTEVPGGISDPETAIRLPREAIAVTSRFTLFDGQDPTVFESDPNNPVRFDGRLARISTSAASAGARVIIGAGLSSRLAGKTVRVTLDARSARENGATSMRFAYESGVAISHWQTANLAADFTELGLVWRVPALRTDPEGDYIVIEPGLPGSGTGVEIRSVRIDLIDQ